MISGFNTDIRQRGVVFHVQTEDKGLSNPNVESLVYVGGRILTRRNSSYEWLLKEGGGREAIAALMERQHREMIAEVRSGRLDGEVGEKLAPDGEKMAEASPGSGAVVAEEGDETRSLDQVILDYLSSEAEQEHLVLVMDSPDELRPGHEAVFAFQAQSSVGGRPLGETLIEVRLISTESEPSVLASGTTDGEGKLELSMLLPVMRSGTAALIIAARSDVGTAEIKHLI